MRSCSCGIPLVGTEDRTAASCNTSSRTFFYGAPDSCDAPQSRFDPMTLFLNRQSFMKRGRLRWEDTAAALTSIGRSLRLHCSILQSRLSKVPVASWVFRIRADERYCLANEAGIRESTKIYH
jgi:hypothetical protein